MGKFILWIEDEAKIETARIRKLKRELLEGYSIKLFERPYELYNFMKDNHNKVAGIIVDLMLPASEEDFKILGERVSGFDVGAKLAEVICREHPEIPMIVLTNLSKYTQTGKEIWEKLERVECIKEKLSKSESSLKQFIEAVKEKFEVKFN